MRLGFLGPLGLASALVLTVLGCGDDEAASPPVTARDVGSSTNPSVVVDAGGNALAVWKQYGGSGFQVWANYFKPAVGWEGAMLLDSRNANADDPEVAIAPSGEAMVVWRSEDECCDAWASYFTPDGGWQEPERVEDSRGDQIAMDALGRAVIVWTSDDRLAPSDDSVWANRFTAESGWTGPELVDLLETEPGAYSAAGNLDLEVNAAGIAVVAWSRAVGVSTRVEEDGRIVLEGYAELAVNQFNPATGWQSAQQLDEYFSAADVALDSQGNSLVVWSRPIEGDLNVWSSQFQPGAGWGDGETLNDGKEPYAHPSSQPKVAMNADGTAVTVWIVEGLSGVASSRFTPGSGWQAPELLEAETDRFMWEPRVAIDSKGDAVVVWLQTNPDRRDEIWGSRFTADHGWAEAERINVADGDADKPCVAMDPVGNAVVVWHQSDGNRFSIRSSRFTPDGGWSSAEVIDETPLGQ